MSESKETTEKADQSAGPSESPPHHEEESVTTRHAITIDDRELGYEATTGRLLLRSEAGEKQASFFFTAYVADGYEPGERPVVFAFNGGPGSSSVWLHLGLLGPRRVVDDNGISLPPPAKMVDNEHTILEVADLVLIDPVGTGFSRGIPADDAKKFHHFTKDIESIGEFVALYLSRHGRWGSEVFLMGESYGTTRAAGLTAHLLDRYGLAVSGVALISSVLDFSNNAFDGLVFTFGNDTAYVSFLPSYAATAWYHGRVAERYQEMSIEEFAEEVRQFARTEYLAALYQGDRIGAEERDRVIGRLADYTGLDRIYLERYHMRIEIMRFCKELLRDEGTTVGRLDSRATGIDRFVDGDAIENDPSYDQTLITYASAANAYLRGDLGYESDLPYEILSLAVHQAWDYEDFKNGYVQVAEKLRSTMTRNRHMRVFVANGYFDLATPFAATEETFAHMYLDPEVAGNVSMAYYQAGHMMYSHPESLTRLAKDLKALVTG